MRPQRSIPAHRFMPGSQLYSPTNAANAHCAVVRSRAPANLLPAFSVRLPKEMRAEVRKGWSSSPSSKSTNPISVPSSSREAIVRKGSPF